MGVAELLELSERDKLHAMELLWESLAPTSKSDAPLWHDEVILERLEKVKSNETSSISLEDFKKKYL